MATRAAAVHETAVDMAAVPAQNLEAEESVLGAILVSGAGLVALETARETLAVEDFFRESHSLIYAACCSLADRGVPPDPITVADHLDDRGDLLRVGGQARIAELAALVPAAGNVSHYALIVRNAAKDRHTTRVGMRLQEAAQTGGLHNHPEIVAELEQLIDSPGGSRKLRPLWWHEAMTEQIPETTEYVDGVLQAGVLADIVGLPYLHKTAIALELSVKVARGAGHFLGKYEVRKQANVGYFWADDSRAKELERVQGYGARHDLGTCPVALYLNPGLTLPDDLATVRAEIKEHGLGLVVFDSLYNFAPGVDWSKDHAAVTTLYAGLKRICDQVEGLTIVLVDHAAKPSEANRDRQSGHQSFGSIFKAASVRSTIAVEKMGGKLYVSATGNNIRGFNRTPAFWAEDQLEVRLVDDQAVEEKVEELRAIVLEWVRQHPGKSSSKVSKGVGRRPADVYPTLYQLESEGLIVDDLGTYSQLLGNSREKVDPDHYGEPIPDEAGKARKRSAWRALDTSEQAEQAIPMITGNGAEQPDDSEAGQSAKRPLPEPFPPVGGKVGRRPEGDPEAPEHTDADAPETDIDADIPF